ncbi:hypothetical protein M3197_09100 [Sporosarcina aquimarina]|uniref:hypothetical protein n=1 Tax=Sporosarcina aquimarina TaxID=114975 RepID=UPI00203E19E9|nr:hypothetical protein [Sporosarcina aquimarina]MCM3757646.1 hypothetical protein [Sporosarcina aquimarina]
MKKFRGKRRWFRNLSREVTLEDCNLQCDNDAWFDLWHNHLDFSGYGNHSLRLRRKQIQAHIDLYKNILKKLETIKKPYQSWVHIDDENAGSDAVFIHTPNPNEDKFPLKVESLNWNCTIPTVFQDLINTKDFMVGQYKAEGGYIIQSKTHGNRVNSY